MMSESPATEIIYQGTKAYWRTRNSVDLMVVHHIDHDALEVITYEPSFDREASRIFLDNAVLESKIDQTEIEEKLKAAKEPILRRREVPDNEKLRKQIVNNTKVAYILNRLSITEFTPEDRVIRVELQFNFRDHDDADSSGTDVSAIIRQKTENLVPYKSTTYLSLLEGVEDILIDELRRGRMGLSEFRSLAGLYAGYEDVSFNRREYWRMPFVYAKVKNGKGLSKKERRIWAVLTRGMKPEEAVAIVGQALDIPLSAEELEEIARTTAELARKAAAKVSPKRANKRGSFIRASFGGGTTPTAKTTRRGSMTFTAGLSALTESMKRRVGMTVSTEAAAECQEGGDGAEAEGKRTSTSTARTPKTTTRSSINAEQSAGRTTNISVTPKPRSYLIKPKRRSIIRTSDTGTGTGAASATGGDAANPPQAAEQTADEAADRVVGHVPFRAGSVLSTSGKFAASVAGDLSARLSASVAAFTSAIRGTFSTKGRLGSVRVAVAEMPDGADDDFNAPAAPTAGLMGAQVETKGLLKEPTAAPTAMKAVVTEDDLMQCTVASCSLDAVAEEGAAVVPVMTVQSPIGESKSMKGGRSATALDEAAAVTEAPLEQ